MFFASKNIKPQLTGPVWPGIIFLRKRYALCAIKAISDAAYQSHQRHKQ
jgi:hypothetical protein